MVTLRLGEGADPIGEGQRVGEAREVENPLEPGDAVSHMKSPASSEESAGSSGPPTVTG